MAKKKNKKPDIETGETKQSEQEQPTHETKPEPSALSKAVRQCFGCSGRRLKRRAYGFWDRLTGEPTPLPLRGTPAHRARLRHLHERNHKRESKDNLMTSIILLLIYAITDIADQLIKPEGAFPLFSTLTVCQSLLNICMGMVHKQAEGHHAHSTNWHIFFNVIILGISSTILANSVALLAVYHTHANEDDENNWVFGLTVFQYMLRAALIFPEIATITKSFRDATRSPDSARDELADEDLGYGESVDSAISPRHK